MTPTMRYEKIVPTEKYPYKIFSFKMKSPDRLVPPHWHESAELLFCLAGELEVQFSNQKYQLKPLDMLFINSNEVHSSRSPVPGRCLAIQFPLEYLEQLTEGNYFSNYLFALTPAGQSENLVQTLLTINDHFDQESVSDRLQVNAKIYLLFAILCGQYSYPVAKTKQIKSAKYLEKMQQINRYILANHKQSLKIEQVAEKFNYNPSYFSRFYKKFMGVTFTEYLHSVRLESAYKQLRDSDQTILEISLNNGFANVRSFYNVFQENFGMSPQKYRQQYLKK